MQIRVMSRQDIDLALDWGEREGWNPGLHDALPFHVADPAGYLVGIVDDAPVATISVVCYRHSFAFLGFYIVREDMRGRGHGMALWRAGMKIAGVRSIGLDGVLAEQARYERSGFTEAWRSVCMEGSAAAGGVASGLVDARAVPFAELLAYDHCYFGAPRPAFLAAWIALPESLALAAVLDGAVTGFGVIRPCRMGWEIGPLFADDEMTAELLFLALSAHAAGSTIRLDVPATNEAALRLARRHGLEPQFELSRMYRGPAPAMDMAGLYGITSYALG